MPEPDDTPKHHSPGGAASARGPVAVLLERAASFRKGSTFLTEPGLEAWLIRQGFAVPAGDGQVTPTALAYDVVELPRFD
jgi:hypothetical protein